MNSFWRETECTVCSRQFTVTHSRNLVNHSRIYSGESLITTTDTLNC